MIMEYRTENERDNKTLLRATKHKKLRKDIIDNVLKGPVTQKKKKK